MPYDVVSFGETMLRLSPAAGTRLEGTRSFQAHVAGSESNVLACLARLGLSCAWLSALPANPMGRSIATEIRRHGVDTSALIWSEPTGRVGIYYAEESADPLGVQVYYDRADSACARIDPDLVDLSVMTKTRMLHLSGITPALGNGARVTYRRLLERAREIGLPISFDVNFRAKIWSAAEAADAIEDACRAACILFCTRDDAASLWRFTGSPREVLERMSERFGRANVDQTIVLTLGKDGAMQRSSSGYTESPAVPSTGAVRFGSGDAFAAGYLAAYLNSPALSGLLSNDHDAPLKVGNAVAALKRCISGDIAVIGPEDVAALLQMQEGVRFR